MVQQTGAFHVITPTVGVGQSPPDSAWQPVATVPLLILVGVTGVGKSTTLAKLSERCAFTLLPDRRALTDDLIIPEMQTEAGVVASPVTDRTERFAYTRRYRETYSGGMAHALAQLQIRRDDRPGLLLFDGLRGANEVTYAAQHLPMARFALLDAPDRVRVQRLLGRADDFDQVNLRSRPDAANGSPAESLPEAHELFTPGETAALLAWAEAASIPLDDLRAKLVIVAAERRNYDPTATRLALEQNAPDRTTVIDTSQQKPDAVADTLAAFVNQWLASGQIP